ncbi:hypothetical protein Bca101_008418 [Brassica carinata]
MVICGRGANGRSEKGQAIKEAGGVVMILSKHRDKPRRRFCRRSSFTSYVERLRRVSSSESLRETHGTVARCSRSPISLTLKNQCTDVRNISLFFKTLCFML